jgi:hypothetical protein
VIGILVVAVAELAAVAYPGGELRHKKPDIQFSNQNLSFVHDLASPSIAWIVVARPAADLSAQATFILRLSTDEE